MVRNEKCRRCNAGTTTAVFRPRHEHASCSTTASPRQEPTSPHAVDQLRSH
jgi:hypothetical protein